MKIVKIVETLCVLLIALVTISCSSTATVQQEQPDLHKQTEKNSKQATEFRFVKSLAHIIGGEEALYSKLRYPEKAHPTKLEPTLLIDVLINKKGDIEQISFKEEIGYGFEEAALEALEQLSFNPGIGIKGEPIRMMITIPIVFKL